MQKLIAIILILALIPAALALKGNDSSGNDIRFATGYLTFNSTETSNNVQAFGDYISDFLQEDNFTGWLSQLEYNLFAPNQVELHLPPNNTFSNSTPIFDWSNTTDPERFRVSYLFEIWNNSAATNIHFVNYTIKETANTTSTIPIIKSDTTVYWRVAANDSTKNSTFSELRAITIDTVLPTNFNLTSPADGTSSTDTTPELIWEFTTEPNLQNYTIEVSTIADFSTTHQTEVTKSNILSNWSAPLNQGTYYWRVTAVDKANNQRLSDNSLSFIVEASATETVSSGSSGSTSSGGGSKPFTLNIIAPEGVILKENDVVTIPLIVTNPSTLRLRGVSLSVSSDTPAIIPSLNREVITEIDPRSEERVLLTLDTQNLGVGTYGITIGANVGSPSFQDEFRIFANLLEKDSALSNEVSEQLDFAKSLFNGNPACLDLSEFLTEAEIAAQQGDNDKAISLIDAAIESCDKLLEETQGGFDFLTSQAVFLNNIKRQVTSKNFLIIAPQVLGLLIISLSVLHFVRKTKHKI